MLIAEDKLLPNSRDFIAILEHLKTLDSKQNIFSADDVLYLNNLDGKFKSILQDKDAKIEVDIHTNPVDGKVLYEVLREPFVRNLNRFRGAFYNHVEIIKGR